MVLDSAYKGVGEALRPATRSAHRGFHKSLMSFIAHYGVELGKLAPQDVVAYLHLLKEDNLSYATIYNHHSGLKSAFNILNVSTLAFEHTHVRLMLKYCERNIRIMPRLKGVFSIEILTKIMQLWDQFDHPVMYKAIIFVRISWFPENLKFSAREK